MKKDNSLFIRSNEDLLKVLRCKEVTDHTAVNVTKRFLNVVTYARTRTEILKLTEAYLKTFGELDTEDRPVFLEQKGIDFDISDLYNLDK